MMYDCFLSYGSEDVAAAQSVYDWLTAAGLRIGWDKVYLEAGMRWHEEIEQHCEASHVVIPLLTPEWKQSEWTRYETYGAQRVLPLLLRGTWADVLTPPLARYQGEALDFTAVDPDWTRFLDRVRLYANEPRPVKGAPDRPTLLKHRPIDHFFGRDKTLVELHEELFLGKLTALTQDSVIAIPALGGVGKTTLARHYAEKFWRCYRQMFWIDCRLGVESGFAGIYDFLHPGEELSLPQNIRAQRAKTSLEQPGSEQTLLILDNAEDEKSSQPWLPASGDCHVLITSRFADWSEGVRKHPVWVLDPTPAREFLLKSAKRSGPAEEIAAGQVAAKLGYLPLALEQAAAYVAQQTGFGFADYLRLYESNEKHFLSRKAPNSVYLTWRTTREKLPEGARQMLQLHAFFAPTPFPLSLYISGLARIADEITIREWKDALVTYSMAQSEPDDCISVHALVQAVERHELGDRAQEVAMRAVDLYWAAAPNPSWDLKSQELWKKLASHTRALADCSLVDDIARGDLYSKLVGAYLHKGNFADGAMSARLALDAHGRALATNHPSTLTSANNLAQLLSELGEYGEAESLHRRTLELREGVLGPGDRNTLNSASNLALVLDELKRYSEAESYCRWALKGTKRLLGREHPDTLTSSNNLALILLHQKKHSEAEPIFRRVIKAQERVLGEEHRDTLASVSNLSLLLIAIGNYSEAELLLRRVLGFSERAMGPEHPNTLAVVNNLAGAIENQSNYLEAEPLYHRVLVISQEVLGPDHPKTKLAERNHRICLAKLAESAKA